MPDVELFAGLRDAVAGAKSVQVEGTTIRELLQNIAPGVSVFAQTH